MPRHRKARIPAVAVLLLAAAVGCAAPATTAAPAAVGVAPAVAAPRSTAPRTPATTRPAAVPRTAAAAAKPAPKPAPAAKPAPAPKPAPKAVATSGCNSNYSPCVPDDPKDVDCRGGSGNGPSYVAGPVRVTGSDVYGLDSDHDGIGCE